MNITLLGTAPHLQWFASRLSGGGLHVETMQMPPFVHRERIGPGWHSGLMIGDLLVDTGPSALTQRFARAKRCRQGGLDYAELAGHWLEPGTRFGFPLFLGCAPEARERLQPVLDLLAPQAGAWLFCGPAGGGCYAATTFDALASAAALAARAGYPVPGEAPHPPDWSVFFRQQTELAARLLEWAQLYLAHIPADDPGPAIDPWALLARFGEPPATQAHFAANLARLVMLALGQGLALQDILQTLIPAPQA